MTMAVICWIAFGMVVATVAASRDEGAAKGCLWFALGVLLGPLALILAFSATGRKCPECRSRVSSAAKTCKFCHLDLEAHDGAVRKKRAFRQKQREADIRRRQEQMISEGGNSSMSRFKAGFVGVHPDTLSLVGLAVVILIVFVLYAMVFFIGPN